MASQAASQARARVEALARAAGGAPDPSGTRGPPAMAPPPEEFSLEDYAALFFALTGASASDAARTGRAAVPASAPAALTPAHGPQRGKKAAAPHPLAAQAAQLEALMRLNGLALPSRNWAAGGAGALAVGATPFAHQFAALGGGADGASQALACQAGCRASELVQAMAGRTLQSPVHVNARSLVLAMGDEAANGDNGDEVEVEVDLSGGMGDLAALGWGERDFEAEIQRASDAGDAHALGETIGGLLAVDPHGRSAGESDALQARAEVAAAAAALALVPPPPRPGERAIREEAAAVRRVLDAKKAAATAAAAGRQRRSSWPRHDWVDEEKTKEEGTEEETKEEDMRPASKPVGARYTAEEDAAICALVREHGVASEAMFEKEAKLMPVLEGRSAAALQNRVSKVLRKRLEKEAAGGAQGNAAPVASGATEDDPIARIEAAMQAAIAAAPSSPSGAAADETVSLLADDTNVSATGDEMMSKKAVGTASTCPRKTTDYCVVLERLLQQAEASQGQWAQSQARNDDGSASALPVLERFGMLLCRSREQVTKGAGHPSPQEWLMLEMLEKHPVLPTFRELLVSRDGRWEREHVVLVEDISPCGESGARLTFRVWTAHVPSDAGGAASGLPTTFPDDGLSQAPESMYADTQPTQALDLDESPDEWLERAVVGQPLQRVRSLITRKRRMGFALRSFDTNDRAVEARFASGVPSLEHLPAAGLCASAVRVAPSVPIMAYFARDDIWTDGEVVAACDRAYLVAYEGSPSPPRHTNGAQPGAKKTLLARKTRLLAATAPHVLDRLDSDKEGMLQPRMAVAEVPSPAPSPPRSPPKFLPPDPKRRRAAAGGEAE